MDISIKCDSLKAIYSVKNGMLRSYGLNKILNERVKKLQTIF